MIERRLPAVEHGDLVTRRCGVPLEAVDVLDSRHVRKERRRRDADVAHPDDADPPDRAAFPDKRCQVLGHCLHLRFVFKVDILSSVTSFCGAGRVQRDLRRAKCRSGETIYVRHTE